MEEQKKPTAKELCGKLNENTKAEDLVAMGYTQHEAEFISEVYKKGLNEYRWKHYDLKQKYERLCVSVCEKLIIDTTTWS